MSRSARKVMKVTIPREGKAHGLSIAGSMGLTTWAHDGRGGPARDPAADLARGVRSALDARAVR